MLHQGETAHKQQLGSRSRISLNSVCCSNWLYPIWLGPFFISKFHQQDPPTSLAILFQVPTCPHSLIVMLPILCTALPGALSPQRPTGLTLFFHAFECNQLQGLPSPFLSGQLSQLLWHCMFLIYYSNFLPRTLLECRLQEGRKVVDGSILST